MQKAYLPMDVINLSQGYGRGSHLYSLALDLSGKDSGKDPIYAPFDCKVTKVYAKPGKSFEVWLESLTEVECANGYIGYLTISITHPTEIKDMKVGQIFKQGEIICYEGKEGSATGNHIHLEVSKGKNCSGWDVIRVGKNTYYVNKNKVKPEEYLFIKQGSIIKNDVDKAVNKKYNFIVETNQSKSKTTSDLVVHNAPNFDKSSTIGMLGKNTQVEIIGEEGKCYKIKLEGYVSKNYVK